MKKSIILFFMVLALLMTSTVPALALGNDYTFTDTWYQGVINNTVVHYNYKDWSETSSGNFIVGSDSSVTTNTSFLSLDGSLVGEISSPTHFPLFLIGEVNSQYSPEEGYYWLSFNSPFNVTVKPQQDLNFQVVVFSFDELNSDNYNLSCTVRLNLSDGTYISLATPDLQKQYFSDSDIGHIVVSSSSSYGIFESDYSGEAVLLNVSWTNDSDEEVVVSSVTTSCSTNYTTNKYPITGFAYGFLAQNMTNEVILPSYVEDNLINISNQLTNQSNQLNSILQEFDELQVQIQALIDAQGFSGSTTNNYYQTITTPTESQQIKQSELDKAVEDAKTEVQELKEVTQSVQVPVSDDLKSSTISDVATTYIKDSQQGVGVYNSLSYIYRKFPFVVDMLMIVLALATVGYVLYGKRT